MATTLEGDFAHEMVFRRGEFEDMFQEGETRKRFRICSGWRRSGVVQSLLGRDLRAIVVQGVAWEGEARGRLRSKIVLGAKFEGDCGPKFAWEGEARGRLWRKLSLR